MKPQLTLVPSLSILPDRINLYNEVCWHPFKPSHYDQESGEKLKLVKYDHLLNSERSASGKVSDIARRKISKAVDYLLLLSRPTTAHAQMSGRTFNFRIAFITLTLPSKQIHDDNEIKSKCLNSFLDELRKVYMVKHYIWRAEKQVNGNIHFHILVNRFIPHQELRDRWNRIINKLGYVDRYRDEQKNWHKDGFRLRKELLRTWSARKQYEAYQRGSKINWNSPNSTDVHSIRKVHNIKLYVTKYMVKNEKMNELKKNDDDKEQLVSGRIWGCDQSLSKAKSARLVMDNQVETELKELVQATKCRTYQGDYFQVFYIDFSQIPHTAESSIFCAFADYIFSQFGIELQQEFG